MAVRIVSVDEGSLASRAGVQGGHSLLSVDGKEIGDFLDYWFYTDKKRLALCLMDNDGKEYAVTLTRRSEGEELGLNFENYLMDKERPCQNNCIFCFVDQLPCGMRETLYFKDDDTRLSFLYGNYITLTNLTEREVNRIIDMHISPVNVSVHTMNPTLRVQMMRHKRAGESLDILKRLAFAGTKLNTQLVVCPKINDGKELEYSLTELGKLYPAVQSIAVVPVGLTRHREGLYPLEAFTEETARQAIDIVDNFNAHFMYFHDGARLAFAADELYLKARCPIPDAAHYGDFLQLDNGVGMLALLKDEFLSALKSTSFFESPPRAVTLATGEAAFTLMNELCASAREKYPFLTVNVIKIGNRFFGESVTVAGLLTGQDILKELENIPLGDELLIPRVSLRFEGDLFLDGMSLQEVRERLKVKVTPVENDGNTLLSVLLGVNI